MPEYDNTNSGALFRNDRKVKQNQPDHRGSMETQCEHCQKNTEFWLSAWIKTGKSGKFFSLALTPKEEQTEKEPAKDMPADFDEDIPF